jgi:hypothetical protein
MRGRNDTGPAKNIPTTENLCVYYIAQQCLLTMAHFVSVSKFCLRMKVTKLFRYDRNTHTPRAKLNTKIVSVMLIDQYITIR